VALENLLQLTLIGAILAVARGRWEAPAPGTSGMTQMYRQRNIHDRIGGKSEREQVIAMLSSLSSSRIRVVVSLAGVALSIVGFFLPMFIESNPGVPGSAHPVYEWQVVMRLASSSMLAGSFAALSLLGVLI